MIVHIVWTNENVLLKITLLSSLEINCRTELRHRVGM